MFFLTINIGLGQGGNYTPKIIPPSPNAASLGKYGEIPVSYYTGLPNISIPIYDIQDKAGSHSISISYHASGIKVAEEASRVGLGWALNAGGVISRNIIGGDDFEGTNYFGGAELPRGVDYTPIDNYQLITGFIAKFAGLNSQHVNLSNAIYDKTSPEFEPDIYNFNIGGISGKFLITKNKEVILQDKKKIKIEMIEGPSTGSYGANISWKITTDNGTSYFFNEKETSLDQNSKFHVNSWYLTKIKSVDGSEISFNYTIEPGVKVYSQGSISENKIYNILGSICPSNPGGAPQSFPPSRAASNTYSLVYISSIVFANGKVVFTYNTETDKRLDVSGDKKINAISIYKNDISSATPVLLKEFSFNYEYFDGGMDEDYPGIDGIGSGSVSKRLKLKSITEKVGTKSLPAHEFTYNEGGNYTNLPAKTSFAIDHWGYFNGKYGNTSLIPTFSVMPSNNQMAFYTGVQTGIERNSNPDYAQAFTLKTIKYPTGGETEFIYESNEYDLLNSQARDFSTFGKNGMLDIEQKQVSIYYNMSNKNQIQEFEIDISDAVSQTGGETTSLDLTAFCRFYNPEICSSINQNGNVYFEIVSMTTGGSGLNVDMFSSNTCGSNPSSLIQGVNYVNSFNLKPGKYKLRAFVTNSTTHNVVDMTFTLKYYAPKAKTVGAKGYTGGLRIKAIKNNDGSKIETTNYKYTLTDNSLIEKSSGIRMAAPQYSYWEKILTYNTSGLDPCNNYIDVLRRTSNSIFPLNASASGSVVGYSVVTVEKEANNEKQGKTIYYYDNKPDVVNNYDYFRTPQNASVPYEQNGNLLTEEVYNSQNKKLKETQYTYSQGTVKPLIIWGLDKRSHQYYSAGAVVTLDDEFFFYPAIKSTFTFLKEKVEKTFDPTDLANVNKVLENKETYTYDENLHFLLTEKITNTSKLLSDGSPQRLQTLYKYPSDFAVTGNAYAGMIGQHNYSPVITEQTNLETLNGSNKVFNQVFLKKTSYIKQKDERTINSVTYPAFYAPETLFTQLKSTSPLTPEIYFLEYDNYGNLLKYKEKNGLTTSLSYFTDISLHKGFLHLPSQKQVGGGIDGIKLNDKTTTLYSYYPLVGLKNITDPNGKITTYSYDDFGRLKSIADNGGVLKEYTYHYGSQAADYTLISTAIGVADTLQPCKMCCSVEAQASSNSPIVNCSSGQITLNGNGSSTDTDVTYSWSGPNNYTSSLKSPIITGDLTKAGGVYTLVVTKSNSTCQVSETVSTKVVLDCICPYTINTTGTTVGPLACQSSISLVGNCTGCSTGELVAGTETYVTNGKFDNSSTPGFSSDCSTYFTTTPQSINGSFNNFGNHSSNVGGNMLLIGHSTNNSERVWYQTITVQPNTRYVLSAWISGAYNNNATKVNWEVDGTPLTEVVDMANKVGGLWQQLKSVWVSGNQTSVTIAIRKQNTFGHNWFVLDDISMTSVLPAAKFEWTGPDNFFASTNNAIIRNVGLKNGGTYQLKVVSNGCTKISEVNVTVNCQPCLDSSPLTVYANSNSPVSCGSPITLFASANKRNVSYTWYKLNSDGTDALLPEAEKNKQNPTITAPSIAGTNRYGYMVTAYKDGCTASYTTPVEVKCIQDGDADIAMSVYGDAGVTTVTVGQQFGICGELINQSSTNNVGSVRASILLPECLEFTGPTWGLPTGAHEENANSFYEDIWYNPITREVSNLTTQARRGTDTWKYWGTPIGANQSKYMCFGVKALKAGSIVVKGQISVVETTQAQSMRDKDSEPGNGYDNGEDDRALVTFNAGANSISVSTYQIRGSYNASINDVDVTSVNSTWTATVSDSWINIDKTTGTNGLSTIKVTLANNINAKTRFGTLTIDAGCGLINIVKIKQSGKEDCPTIDLSSNNPFCNNPLQLFANLIPSTNKELISNGNFEKGNIDFSPEAFHYYDPQIGGTLAYVVSANPKTENGSTGMGFINMECPGENTNSTCNVVNRVRLLFRSECCFDRLNGAKIQVSNDKNTWTTLYTFGNATGAWQDVSFSNTTKYMYVRFVSSSTGYGELREIEFYNGTTKLSGLIFGSTGINGSNVLANAMDGLENNLWHGSAVGESNFVGLELEGCTLTGIQESESACKAVNRVRVLFRSECCFDRLNGAKIQVSNDKNTWTTLHTFGNATGAWQDISINNTTKYMYVRFVSSSTGYGELREIEFYSGTTKLSGQIFGSTAINGSNVLANAMDGLENNLWHGSAVGESNFVELELTGCTLVGIIGNEARGSGKQMAVAASWRQKEKFWSQTILVDPNTDYKISVKAVQLGNYDNVPVQLIFDVDGVPTNVQGTISTTGCTWQKISGIWNSGEKFGPVKLTITFVNSNFNNKIFAIDDISVKPNLQGTTSNSPISYSWIAPTTEAQNDLIGASTANPVVNIVKGKHTGVYKLTASQNGCPVTETIDVDIACSSLTCPAPIINSPYARVCINMNQKASLNAIGCPLGSVVRWSDGQTSTPQTYTNPSNGVVTTISTVLTAAIKTGTSFFAQCQTECGISNKSNDLFVHAVETPAAPKITPQSTIQKAPGEDGTVLFASGCSDGIIKWSNGMTGSSTWIPSLGFKVGDYVEVTAKCITDCGESLASSKVKIVVSCNVVNPSYAKAMDVPTCSTSGGLVTLDGACNIGNVVWYKEGDPSFTLTGNTVKAYVTGNSTFRARCESSVYCVSDMISVPVNIGAKLNSPSITSIPSNVENTNKLNVKVNAPISLTANNCPAGSTVSWSLTGYSPNSSTSQTINITPTAVGQITAQATCVGQCSSDPTSIIINVETDVVCTTPSTWSITPSGSISVAQNATQTLSASGCTSGTIKWYLGDVEKTSTNNGTTVDVTVNTSTEGSYNYTSVCTVGSCTFTKVIAVTVPPTSCNLTAVASTINAVCGSTGIQTSVTKNGTTYSNVQYIWYYRPKNTTSDGYQIGNTNTITALQDGEYKVKVIDNSNTSCIANSSWVPITIITVASNSFAISPSGNVSIIKGATQTLSASGCTSGLVEWYLNGIKQSGSTTQPLNLTANSNIVGVYNYTATCTIGACISSKNIAVTVNETPCALSVTLSKTKICGSTDFKATALKNGTQYAGVQYKWYYRATSTSTPVLLTTSMSNHNTVQTGDYKVEISENNCIASSSWVSDTVMTSISQTPVASGTITIDKGTATNLSASGCPAGTSYVWSDGTIGTLYSVSPSKTTSYTVKCQKTGNNAICESNVSNTVTVTINCTSTPPVLEYYSPTSKVCTGDSITIKAACSNNGTIKWYNTDAATTPIATGPTYTTSAATIWASCTQTGSTCESTKASIETQIDFGNVSITPNCDFNRYDVTPSDVDAYTYEWKRSDVTLPVTTPYLDNISTGGTYAVIITRRGTSCYKSIAHTLSLPISGYPAVSLTNTDYCDSTKLNVTLGNTTIASSPYQYKWFKEGSQLGISNTLQYTATSSGNYKVEVTASNGCKQSAEKYITVTNKPAKPTISRTSSCYNSGSVTGVSLTANCPSGSTPQWDNNLGTSTIITVKPTASTTYKVKCVVGACTSDWEETTISICPPSPTICGFSIQSPSGSTAYYTQTINYSGANGAINVRFETFCVPDRLVISINGTKVLDGVCMGSGVTQLTNPTALKVDLANYSLNVNNGDTIKVEVYPTCTDKYTCQDNPNTAWNIYFSCVTY